MNQKLPKAIVDLSKIYTHGNTSQPVIYNTQAEWDQCMHSTAYFTAQQKLPHSEQNRPWSRAWTEPESFPCIAIEGPTFDAKTSWDDTVYFFIYDFIIMEENTQNQPQKES